MLKAGMYVRCPVDLDAGDVDDTRTYFIGQVVAVKESGELVVRFHDPLGIRNFFTNLPQSNTYQEKHVSRVAALCGTVALFKGHKVRLLHSPESEDREVLRRYYVEYFKDGRALVGAVSEAQIEIPFTRADFNPVYQMLRYELHNPMWYMNRRIVSKSLNEIENAPFGFKNLLGMRVLLFTHQVDTIVRALSESPCRLMLADEVGLGKTIETLAILKGMTDRRPNLRALIVVPGSLIFQWQTEIDFKFWKEALVWGVDHIEDPRLLLVSTEDLAINQEEIGKLCRWDVCVVDEAHRLLAQPQLYRSVLALCRDVEHLLLLSATPILRREEEYAKLLTLLNPERFETMSTDEFRALIGKQRNIQNAVFDLMRDLPDYQRYDDLPAEFAQGLRRINEELRDDRLAKIIDGIDPASEDKGLSQVKLTLSYIAEFYQIERGIIRHRRAELSSADVCRRLVDIPYEMAGSDVGYPEERCYNAVMDLAETLQATGNHQELVRALACTVSSSPNALAELLRGNEKILRELDTAKVKAALKDWLAATDDELCRITTVSEDIDRFYGKFAKIVDYIDQEDARKEKKFLLFSGFPATAKRLEHCLKTFFGERAVCAFYADMTSQQMQESATLFQNEAGRRFLVCDESGGEGRNFQMADYVLHCDLPFSPALLEQRIGRLDRIGRLPGRDVVSVVVHSQNSFEGNLFDIYHKGLNIFNQSLCGMEIAFQQIHDTMEVALEKDVRSGLVGTLPELSAFVGLINGEIEKERYYDLARQLDMDLQERLGKLISYFSDDEGRVLMDTMLAWPHMAGFRGVSVSEPYQDDSKVVSINTTDLSLASMENAVYFPPKMDEIVRRSRYHNDIRGTFSRTAAVKHENLAFFAPNNPFFDSITANAEECYKGRCTALHFKDSALHWKGIVQTWHVRYNPEMVFSSNHSPELIALISRYLQGEPVYFTLGVNAKYNAVPAGQVVAQLNALRWERPVHLGKRGNGALGRFKEHYPPDQWQQYVKMSYQMGRRYAREQAELFSQTYAARGELERQLAAHRAREVFYGCTDQSARLKDAAEMEALLHGLHHPLVELDSIAFVVLEP